VASEKGTWSVAIEGIPGTMVSEEKIACKRM